MYDVPLSKFKNVPNVKDSSTKPADPVTLPVTLPVKFEVIRLALKFPEPSLETIVPPVLNGVASVCICLALIPL